MTDFITPESVKDLIPILLKDEEIENINLLIKDMIKCNYKNCHVITLSESEGAKIKSVIERLCKLGWRVYSQNAYDMEGNLIKIMVDNPYYKANDEWVNELESYSKRE